MIYSSSSIRNICHKSKARFRYSRLRRTLEVEKCSSSKWTPNCMPEFGFVRRVEMTCVHINLSQIIPYLSLTIEFRPPLPTGHKTSKLQTSQTSTLTIAMNFGKTATLLIQNQSQRRRLRRHQLMSKKPV